MTIEQTRQLGIEFERRVQTMIPDKEFGEKLDTETIYSYLNQYQDKYVHDIYRSIDLIPTSNNSVYIETILQGLIETFTKELSLQDKSDCCYTVTLPDDFGLYINSTTTVSDVWSYKDKKQVPTVMLNLLMSKAQEKEFLNTAYDSMRIIRKPLVYLDANRTIQVFTDKYTIPTVFKMSYYKVPQYMNLFENASCELPMEAFEPLVSGAVDMYVQYVAGAEARKRLMIEELNKRNREDQRDARRNAANNE